LAVAELNRGRKGAYWRWLSAIEVEKAPIGGG
jgi:hypothetical protein